LGYEVFVGPGRKVVRLRGLKTGLRGLGWEAGMQSSGEGGRGIG